MTALPSTRKCSLFLGALLLATFPAATFVSAANWTAGGSPDLRWSIAGNWSTSPADENLVFGSTGLAAADVTNIVDAAAVDPNVIFKSLSYIYDNSTLRHHTQIDDGVTLALTGGAGDNVLLVGGQRAATAINTNPIQYTAAAISGHGTLMINVAGKLSFAEVADSTLVLRASNGTDAVGNVRVGFRSGGASSLTQRGVLDLTGGNVDAKITNLTIAEGTRNNTTAGVESEGTFTMSSGTVEVEIVETAEGVSCVKPGQLTCVEPYFTVENVVRVRPVARTGDFPKVIQEIEAGRINATAWVTHEAEFSESASMFSKWSNPETGTIKAIVHGA